MNYRKGGISLQTPVLIIVLLVICGMASGLSAQNVKAEAAIPEGAIHVTNVDEFLAALAPDTTIILEPGVYDFAASAEYGAQTNSTCYSWEEVGGEDDEINSELVISGLDGLTIRGAGMDKTTITTVPRYANVIRFAGCTNLILADFTAGHTAAPGLCSGGVLCLENCQDIQVVGCGLYGCGTIGVDAMDCSNLSITDSRIYECSYSAVYVSQCRNVCVKNCDIDSHGNRPDLDEAALLFGAYGSDGFTVHGCRIHDNAAQHLLGSYYSKNTLFLSNDVHDNRISASMFLFEQYAAMVDGCSFKSNDSNSWIPERSLEPLGVNGDPLSTAELSEMLLRDIDPGIATAPVGIEKAADVRPGGEIAVTSVDEFLKAIGPDRTIVLDAALFDLSTASDYGIIGGEYYYWAGSHDAFQLVICGTSGLTIRAAADDAKATTLVATSGAVNVLSFRDCEDTQIVGFTAGHAVEPGTCSGGVLEFQNCGGIRIEEMRLYGCGILGVEASRCTSIQMLRTEIYECSEGAAQFFQCDGLNFIDCDIHNVPSPAFCFIECGDKTWNKIPVIGLDGMYDVNDEGLLVAAD